MAEKKQTIPLYRDPTNIPVTFVSDVAGSGFANGVCNLTFVTAVFSPQNDNSVDPDFIISARLRMDLFCVQRLRDQLDNILEQNTKGPAQPGKPN